MYEQRSFDTSSVAWPIFRIGIIVVFLLIVGRLYQLQILQGDEFRQEADANRLRPIIVTPKRGVIYDRNGQILARNRPSFEITIVPASLPIDDIETPETDEEAIAIERILKALHADVDDTIAIRIAEIMFLGLGYDDYAATLESIDIALSYVQAPVFVSNPDTSDEGDAPSAESAKSDDTPPEVQLIDVPDTTIPLPLEGLVELVERRIELKRGGGTSDPVVILDLVDRLRAMDIAEASWNLPGIFVEQVPVRDYVYGELISHVLGFMGPIPASVAQDYAERGYDDPNEKVGLSGLEFSYQDVLRGTPGRRNAEVDILGREVGTEGVPTEPTSGSNLILNIDLRLQRVMYESLSAMMEEKEAPWGVTIAMNPQNGAVLGMVSLPEFDNNIFAERLGEAYLGVEQNERKPLINYAIGGLYPPGSVFKVVPAAAALNEGVVSADTIIRDDGPIFLANKFFPNDPTQAQKFVSWNHKLGINHGPIDVVEALALSNDIYFYLIGGGFPPPIEFRGLGVDRLAEWSKLFGYGTLTGIDLPGEVSAIVPTAQWKRQFKAENWTTGDSYNMSIGQGDVLATPIQVLVSIAAVANGGTIFQPQLVHQIVDLDGNVKRDFNAKIVRTLPLQSAMIETVREGMWMAVNGNFGTAIASRIEGIELAGKTGTAEFCEYSQEEQDCIGRDEDDNLPTHAWYTAFAPYENPEIAIVTFVYNGGEGSDAALPVTRDILELYFNEINPAEKPVSS